MIEEFYSQYANDLNDKALPLQLIARQYHICTESYDRIVCTGPYKNGVITPSNGKELAQICRHAKILYKQMEEQVVSMGFSTVEWRYAVRNHIKCYPNIFETIV